MKAKVLRLLIAAFCLEIAEPEKIAHLTAEQICNYPLPAITTPQRLNRTAERLYEVALSDYKGLCSHLLERVELVLPQHGRPQQDEKFSRTNYPSLQQVVDCIATFRPE